MSKTVGMGSKAIADFEKRINIYGDHVVGNRPESKLKDMNIGYKKSNILLSLTSFDIAIVGKKYHDRERIIDTFTYLYEIKSGYEKETYEDEPYIIPYLVEDSDSAIIVIPGGGFGYKSMDGKPKEGKDIAETLNKNGINAFVLHYRSNPYEYPIPYLDVQRAIRFIRFHANKYHIDKDKISLIGYSAGGNIIGTFINIIQGNDYFPEEYKKDKIDLVDDKARSAAMIYPLLSFRYNIPMLFAMFNGDDVRDDRKRELLLKKTDLYKHISSFETKQFIAYGTKDLMVGKEETEKYINNAEKQGVNIISVVAKNKNHGFSQKYYMPEYLKWIKENI